MPLIPRTLRPILLAGALAAFPSHESRLCGDETTARQVIGDRFDIGVNLSRYIPYEITDAKPQVIGRPGVSEDGVQGGVELGTGCCWGYTFRNLKVGSPLPLHGKVFRVEKLNRGKDPSRPSIEFVAVPDSPLLKLISPDGDTNFLPFDSNVKTDYVEFQLHKVKDFAAEAAGRKRIEVRFYKQEERLPKIAARLREDQRIQQVGPGDLIRFGRYGLKVRNIVFPNEEKNIIGWVEVFSERVVVETE